MPPDDPTTPTIRDALPIDGWTLGFAAGGYVVGRYIGINWLAALGLAVAVESIQDALFARFPEQLHETRPNVIYDVVAFMGGFAVGEQGRKR